MGTVRGDLHDIGKNLVGMMAEGAGFKVIDIGVDQSIEKFLAATEQHKPDIIGMSALLTTTMTYMKTVVDGYKERGLTHIKFAVGGAPISQDVRRRNWRAWLRRGRVQRGGFVFVFHGQRPAAQSQIQDSRPLRKSKPSAANRTRQRSPKREIQISNSCTGRTFPPR